MITLIVSYLGDGSSGNMEPFCSPCWLEKQIAFMFWPLGVRELIVNETHSAMGLNFIQASVVTAITDEWQFERITHLLGF